MNEGGAKGADLGLEGISKRRRETNLNTELKHNLNINLKRNLNSNLNIHLNIIQAK